MNSKIIQVVLQRCSQYEQAVVQDVVDTILSTLNADRNLCGTVVLLKPNLISGRGPSICCTHKVVVREVAAWFLAQGAKVQLGDSPAFGSGVSVCKKRGITDALIGMDVELVDFSTAVKKTLPGGVEVEIARQALECDLFVNLAKVKAHNQMYVTLATKNIFGIVKGINKAMLHMTQGESHERFAGVLLDLIVLLPPAFHVTDGIVAMHESGPLDGEPFALGCVGGSTSSVALDTALLELLGLEKSKSPLWRVARQRDLVGSDINSIYYPGLSPSDFGSTGFIAPESLNPIRFNPFNFMRGMVRRIMIAAGGS